MLVIITRWLIITAAILIASSLVPGIQVDSVLTAILAAGVLGLINVFIKPVLLILTLPLSILTLGVFTFFINALLLELVSYFVNGFRIDGFLSAFLGALIISVFTWFANYFINSRAEIPRRQNDIIDMDKGDDGKWR
jgi:putative membrane protein